MVKDKFKLITRNNLNAKWFTTEELEEQDNEKKEDTKEAE
jgi:hypothetical protein